MLCIGPVARRRVKTEKGRKDYHDDYWQLGGEIPLARGER